MNIHELTHDNKGAVLAVGIMFIALLSIIGSTAYILSSSDVIISANYKTSEQAFNNAEAGIQFGIAKIEEALESGIYLPETDGSSMTIPGDSAPSGFSFSLSQLTRDSENNYSFISTGNSSRESTAKIKAAIKRKPAIDLAVFSKKQSDLKNNSGVFSYNSTDSSPDPGDGVWDTSNPSHDLMYSTHHGNIGSNGDGDGHHDIVLRVGVYVDGGISLGQHEGVDAAITDEGAVVAGEIAPVGPIDPDPLNIAVDNEFINKFSTYDPLLGGSNDNGSDITNTSSGAGYNPGIEIDSSDGDITLNGEAGGSNFYFDNIDLQNQKLTLDAQNGPISIWVKGGLVQGNNSTIEIKNTASGKRVSINVTEPAGGYAGADIIKIANAADFNPDGQPSHVLIKTDSAKNIKIHNSGTTKAIVYGPNADIEYKNGSVLYGAMWGNTVAMKSTMKVYFDEAIKKEYPTNKVLMTSWSQILD